MAHEEEAVGKGGQHGPRGKRVPFGRRFALLGRNRQRAGTFCAMIWLVDHPLVYFGATLLLFLGATRAGALARLPRP